MDPEFQADSPLLKHLRQQHEGLLDSDFKTLKVARIFEIDAAFHEAIAACCHNRFLMQAIRQQTKLRRLSAHSGSVSRRRLEESCREHLIILDTIEAGELAQAAELMRIHIETSQAQRPRLGIRGVPPLGTKFRRQG